MPRRQVVTTLKEAEELNEEMSGEILSYTASLVSQGDYRFYTLAMPSDVLAENSTVDRRADNPKEGFQRLLDTQRAEEISEYIDSGFGTIPGSIVLSAQPEARLEYKRSTRTLKFRKNPRAFLILDGQHRVYGFSLAKARLRIPVVIYNGLTKADEAKLFMDINTKQRPVPNELLLAIKQLAQTENSEEALLRSVFDKFDADPTSPLAGLMSSTERKSGRISRVTFNAALRPIFGSLEGSDTQYVYDVVSAYLQAWLSGIRDRGLESKVITNPTLFRAIMLLFPAAAARVSDRYDTGFTTDNFAEVLRIVLSRTKKADLQNPGNKPSALNDTFRKHLESGFSIGRAKAR
jgi:DGQHR domain-containing protein